MEVGSECVRDGEEGSSSCILPYIISTYIQELAAGPVW